MSSAVDITDSNPLKITGVTIKWEIENIWQLSFEGISSGVFSLSDHAFHLHARRYELGIAFYLCRACAKPIVMNLLCKLYMTDHVGQEKLIGEREVVIEKRKEFVFLESVMVNELEARKSEFITNDKLSINCSVSSSYRLNIMKQQNTEGEKIISKIETLSSDMENFFKAQINTDVLLKAGSVEFPVHLTVLQIRSPEIVSNIAHKSAKILEVNNISAAILGDVLFYIYTGKIKNLTSDTVTQMLAAAKRFSLSELKEICQNFLHTNLTDDNVFEAAVLAQEFGDQFLREEIELHIVKKVPTILHSDRWREFCNNQYKLANDILTNVLLRMKTKDNVIEEH